MNNYALLEKFFEEIKTYALSNPNKEITSNFIYSLLIRFNVPNSGKEVYEKYSEILRNFWRIDDGRTEAFEHGHFLLFNRGKMLGNEVKLYVPLKENYITDGVTLLENFMKENNIAHQLKVRDKLTSDNIVIRVNSLEDAQKIKNFIQRSSLFKDALGKVNPFLVVDNGVGMAMDNNFSFNTEVSNLVASFLQTLKKANKMNDFTVSNFNRFVTTKLNELRKKELSRKDIDLPDIYYLITKTTSKDANVESIMDFMSYKGIDKYDEERLRITNPEYYFEQALRLTVQKYPENKEVAVLEYLHGNAKYFTNTLRAREGLKKYVSPENLRGMLQREIGFSGLRIPDTDEKLVKTYFDIKERANVSDEFKILKKAYMTTLEKYDYHQAHGALEKLVLKGDISSFTNDLNCRSLLREALKGKNIRAFLKNYLIFDEHMDYEDITYLIEQEFERDLKR